MRAGFICNWIKNLDTSISCECGFWHFSLAVFGTQFVRSDDFLTLANTKVLLNFTFATIALLSAVVNVSADAIRIPLLGCVASFIHYFFAVCKTVFISFGAISRLETCLANAFTRLTQVLTVKSSAFASCRADSSFRRTFAFLT